MSTHIDALRLRSVLGKDSWGIPSQFGPDGWILRTIATVDPATVIVTVDDYRTRDLWVHASISRTMRMPTYDDLVLLHRGAFGDNYAFQAFVPRAEHVSIHDFCLHLFGLRSGRRPACIPDFALAGASI